MKSQVEIIREIDDLRAECKLLNHLIGDKAPPMPPVPAALHGKDIHESLETLAGHRDALLAIHAAKPAPAPPAAPAPAKPSPAAAATPVATKPAPVVFDARGKCLDDVFAAQKRGEVISYAAPVAGLDKEHAELASTKAAAAARQADHAAGEHYAAACEAQRTAQEKAAIMAIREGHEAGRPESVAVAALAARYAEGRPPV